MLAAPPAPPQRGPIGCGEGEDRGADWTRYSECVPRRRPTEALIGRCMEGRVRKVYARRAGSRAVAERDRDPVRRAGRGRAGPGQGVRGREGWGAGAGHPAAGREPGRQRCSPPPVSGQGERNSGSFSGMRKATEPGYRGVQSRVGKKHRGWGSSLQQVNCQGRISVLPRGWKWGSQTWVANGELCSPEPSAGL